MNEGTSQIPRFCAQCGASRNPDARFCVHCGVSFAEAPARASAQSTRPPLTLRTFLVIGVLSLLVWAIAWGSADARVGRAPKVTGAKITGTQTAQRDDGEDIVAKDPALSKFRSAATKDPKSKDGWKEYAKVLLERLEEQEEPPPKLIFEAIDALRTILDLDSKDSFALLAMANISLNQQVFPKAVDYFERYLSIAPDDLLSRARYGSALAFNGRPQDAILELDRVLAKDPKNFHAAAYLAVTYAQTGEREKAVIAGQRALTNAPSEEARTKFEEFLSAVKAGKVQPNKVDAESAARTDAVKVPGGVAAVEAFIKSKEFAAPRYVRSELRADKSLALFFSQFPMDKMPPFVREKFVSSIKDVARRELPGQVSALVFIDSEAGTEMVRETIQGN